MMFGHTDSPLWMWNTALPPVCGKPRALTESHVSPDGTCGKLNVPKESVTLACEPAKAFADTITPATGELVSVRTLPQMAPGGPGVGVGVANVVAVGVAETT